MPASKTVSHSLKSVNSRRPPRPPGRSWFKARDTWTTRTSACVKQRPFLLLTCLLLSLLLTTAVAAQETEDHDVRDPAFEQEIHDRLAQIDPEAVSIFQEATQAMDEGDLLAALAGYQQVLALAPGFPDALRRISSIELELLQIEAALDHAQQAYDADPSPYNQTVLARALLATENPAHYADAFLHARDAAQALPEDPFVQETFLYAAVYYQDTDGILQASTALTELIPDHPMGQFFAGLAAAEDGDFVEAERRLLLSQEVGMPAEIVEEALADGIRVRALLQRGLWWAIYTLIAWLIGLVVLTLAGLLLSKLTLVAVQRTQSSAVFEVGRGERLLRGVYRLVIAVTSLYFYVSIPLLILVVLAVTLGILYLFLVVGYVPLRLAVFVGLAGLFTLYAIVRSLFVRIKDEEPGRPLLQEEAPHLWSVTQEVAERLETRSIDAIYVTPSAVIAVTERGGLWKKLRGLGQRSLVLGLGALPGMTQGQFQAILAHEYGHFSNRDTAGGNLAVQVQVSLHRMAEGLARAGQARWYNPAWLFLNGFYRIFLRITLGASRLQEILADRFGAMAYGAQNSINGLKHMIRQSLVFEIKVRGEVETALEQERALRNLYALPPLCEKDQLGAIETREAELMSRPTSPYDSHPAPSERITLLEQIEPAVDVEEDERPAWGLLPKRKELQAEMTALVQFNVDQMQKQEP